MLRQRRSGLMGKHARTLALFDVVIEVLTHISQINPKGPGANRWMVRASENDMNTLYLAYVLD